MSIKKINGYQIPKINEVYPNQVDWELNKEESVLLIHDMQQYFVEAYNKTQEPCATLIKNLMRIREICKSAGVPVIYSAQPQAQTIEQRGLLMDFWGKGIPADGKQQEIIKELQPREGDIVITKWRYSAFESTNLEKVIKELGKRQLIVTGIYTHIGCLTTSVAASMKNIKPFLIADATADFSKEKHLLALNYIAQLAGRIMNTEELINELK